MSVFVFINQLRAKDEQRDELVELLREFAVSIHAEPGCLHYSAHVPADDENGPVRVIQAYSSVEAFREHAAWMGPNIPRLAELLEFPPQPPVLLEQVPLSGHPKESLSAYSAAE